MKRGRKPRQWVKGETPFVTFGNMVRERRLKLGVSQTDLAPVVGMSPDNLSSIECGKTFPMGFNFARLVRTLGLTVGPETFKDVK